MSQYRLVSELYAHSGPVRSLSLSPSGDIVSGSQADSPNIRMWHLGQNAESNAPELSEVGVAIPHDHWVTALTRLPSGSGNAMYPGGCIVTGCMDSKIRIFSPIGEPMMILEGHSKGVISLSWTSSGKLISGSWDGTAKVWDLEIGGECLWTLAGHENGVNVLGLDGGLIVTTSTGESVNDKPANFQIRFWSESTGQQEGPSIKDHEGPIRCIAALPGICGIATASNDGTVRVRTIEDRRAGSILGVMCHPLSHDGMPPFLLHCTPLISSSPCELVSCGEDGSVVVWNSSLEAAQIIPHPCSVWCALAIPETDGDFITGSHDGMIRMFSRNPLWTGSSIAIQLDQQLESACAQAQDRRKSGPSAEELAKCPLWSNRGNRAGRNEGDVCVFNKDGKMIAAQWAAVSGAWIEVGEVTGSSDDGTVNGVKYDHVMPVEMETPNGVMTLSLGYSNGENPFVAAKRFIDENQLGQQYLQQIADWILARAGRNSTPTIGASSSYSGSSTPAAPQQSVTNANVFTFTSQSYLMHDDVPTGAAADKILGKIRELNSSVSPASGKVLSDSDFSAIETLLQTLASTSQYHVSVVTQGQIAALCKCASWDAAIAFPAFDIARMVALHPSGSAVIASSTLAPVLLANAVAALSAPITAATALTALRFLGNAFRHDELRSALLRHTNHLSDLFTAAVQGGLFDGSPAPNSKLQRVALSSVALNLATYFAISVVRKPEAALALSGSPAITACNEMLRVMLLREIESMDGLLRAMRAMGLICATWQAAGGQLGASTRAGLAAAVAVAAGNWAGKLDDVSNKCCIELTALLSQ